MIGRKGQSTVEYAVLIVVVIAALLAMGIYMKRGTMGKLRESTNQIGEQFAPLGTTNDYTRTYTSTRNEFTGNDGHVQSNIVAPEVQNKTGRENVNNRLDAENIF